MEDKELTWEESVKQELIDVLDKFLPISKSGDWGVKYSNPVKTRYENGTEELDPTKTNGVMLFIRLEFANTLTIDKTEETSKDA